MGQLFDDGGGGAGQHPWLVGLTVAGAAAATAYFVFGSPWFAAGSPWWSALGLVATWALSAGVCIWLRGGDAKSERIAEAVERTRHEDERRLAEVMPTTRFDGGA